MNTCPVERMESVTGFASMFKGAALVCGRSRGTPVLIIGAATMKMMSSTSITSMNGVMLISLMAPPRRARLRRRELPPAEPAMAIVDFPLSRVSDALVDLARENGRELVGEAFEA